MKKCFTIFFSFFVSMSYSQYLETFCAEGIGVANCSGKGISSCNVNSLSKAQWSLSGDFSEVGPKGVITSDGGLYATNVDREVCWESPFLDISDVEGAVSLSVDFYLDNPDAPTPETTDYINVYYAIDGGEYTLIPNQFGGGVGYTVASPKGTVRGYGEGFLFGTIKQDNISGKNTLKIMICFRANSLLEYLFIDNISVPEANVKILQVNIATLENEKPTKNIS